MLLFVGLLAAPWPAAYAQLPADAGATNSSAADGTRGPNNGSPALTGVSHPLYRLRQSDVLTIKFTFSPDFDQNVTVLPDGFVNLKNAGDVYAEGLTVSELRAAVKGAYAPILRDPEVSVVLADYERPFFATAQRASMRDKSL
jgi:polysaccharide export outer membrane protein